MQASISSEDCKGKLFGYVRVSGDKQEMSPSVQARNLQAWANGREIQIFTELDVSAKLQDFEKRPEARKLLAHVEPDDWVVATKLDRFFRRGSELHFVEKMNRFGIQFYPILESLGDRSTAMGELMELIRIGFAQFESHIISDRTKEAMAHQRANGLPLTGKPPYGKKIEHFTLEEDGKRGAYFVENTDEMGDGQRKVGLIVEAARRRLAGESCQAIADDFCRRGLHTRVFSKKQGKFCKWTRIRVSRATRWYFKQFGIHAITQGKEYPIWYKPQFRPTFFKPPFKPKWFKGPLAEPAEDPSAAESEDSAD